MASNYATKCTVVICHREETKTTLFEILKRMKCEVCEVSSLSDLLNYVESSDFTFFQFSEITPENTQQPNIDYAINSTSEEISSITYLPEKSLLREF